MSEKAMVYIVDDDDAVRRSAGSMLRILGFGVRSYASGVDFLKEVKKLPPGCILLDVRMPDMGGLEVQQKLNAHGVAMPVIVLTGHGDIATAVRAMKGGASDFLEKPFDRASLIEAIERGLEKINRKDQSTKSEHEAKVRIAALTAREQDVLRELVRGHPNKTIAYDLGISPRTVEVHRANVMSKLDVRSLSDALRIAFAARLGETG